SRWARELARCESHPRRGGSRRSRPSGARRRRRHLSRHVEARTIPAHRRARCAHPLGARVTVPVSASSTAAATSPRRNRRTARRLTFLITLCSAVAFVSAYHPPRPLEHAPFVVDSAFGTLAADVEPARDAYGR